MALRHHHWVGSTNVEVMVDVGVGVVMVIVSIFNVILITGSGMASL